MLSSVASGEFRRFTERTIRTVIGRLMHAFAVARRPLGQRHDLGMFKRGVCHGSVRPRHVPLLGHDGGPKRTFFLRASGDLLAQSWELVNLAADLPYPLAGQGRYGACPARGMWVS